jgi:glutathione synthase/RimK-type ligase-like ATP-grasp enzyme
MPATWIFWKRTAALNFCRQASYPMVMKLSIGYQSRNVLLLRSHAEAERWVRKMFGPGLTSIEPHVSAWRTLGDRTKGAIRHLRGKSSHHDLDLNEFQHGYFYVQEFLPGNEFDTRVTVIGHRAFAYRRLNAPQDFRASGSGRIDSNPDGIDPQSVRLAFRVARRLQTQSVAVDVLHRGQERVINEISYTYTSWMVRDCPGHWILEGDTDSGQLVWVDQSMSPEDAIFQDFLELLKRKNGTETNPLDYRY